MSESESRPARPWYRRRWAVLLVLPAAALALLGLLVFFFLFTTIPLPEDIGAGATKVLDAGGNEVGTLSPSASRQDVDLRALPQHVPQAVMSAEDRRFYEHSGISPTGIVRALFTNVREGDIEQGGSTITQQYVKNALVGNERTFTRKAKEVALAVKMEQRLEKDQILSNYLNAIYWGRGAYGIEAASKTYFDTSATELSLNQAATLAGMVQSPENLDPLENPEAADRRRTYTLDGMLEEGWIDQATHDATVAEGLPQVTDRTTVEAGPNAYYLDAVRRELTAELGSEREAFLGLTVHTALDTRMQELAQTAVREAVSDKEYTGALVALDPATGGVRALVGGPDFANQQFNYAVRGTNQVGSAFKPFTLAAFLGEGSGPQSRFPAPATLEVSRDEAAAADCEQGEEAYEVGNYGDAAYGTQTVYDATVSSTNTVYVQMELEAGCPEVIETAESLGLPSSRGGEPTMQPNTSLTLGSFEFTPVEMAAAFGTFASGGVRVVPHLVTRVEHADGDVILEADVEQQGVLRANDAYTVTEALERVVQGGTGTAAQIGRPVAGKTGTTTDNKDGWFVGYTPQLVASVWVGTPDNSVPEESLTGGGVPASIFSSFMAPAMEPLEVQSFPEPDLSEYDTVNPAPTPTETEPTECPEGYSRQDPEELQQPTGEGGEPQETQTEWVVIEGSADDEGRVCASPQPVEPTESPSPSPSPSPTETGAETEVPTLEPSPSPTEEEEPSPSPSPSPSPDPESGSDGGDQAMTSSSTSDSTSEAA